MRHRLILTAALATLAAPVAAQDCGRWSGCEKEGGMSASDLHGYVYGNRETIEPWKTVHRNEKKSAAEETKVREAPKPTRQIRLIEPDDEAPEKEQDTPADADREKKGERAPNNRAGQAVDPSAIDRKSDIPRISRAEAEAARAYLEAYEDQGVSLDGSSFDAPRRETGLGGVSVVDDMR